MEYLLLTIAKNEGKFIETVIDSVRQQSKPPLLWLIVDDGSSDNTSSILKKISDEFIYCSVLKTSKRDIGFEFGKKLAFGFNKLKTLANRKIKEWDFIAKLDADCTLDSKYFEKIVEVMENDRKIGIMSGQLHEYGKKKPDPCGPEPRGAATVYSKGCFEKIGGFSQTPSHESVESIMAKRFGFKTLQSDVTKFVHLRPVGSAMGLYEGHKQMGMAANWLGGTRTYAILRALSLTFRKSAICGIGFLVGFLVWEKGQTKNKLVKNSYKYRWKKLLN
ncbi:MAG: glycosyltransferase [SAR202 cluster bacterium]|nr:glycosyltransferase [SAR202 cluster bacterium]